MAPLFFAGLCSPANLSFLLPPGVALMNTFVCFDIFTDILFCKVLKCFGLGSRWCLKISTAVLKHIYIPTQSVKPFYHKTTHLRDLFEASIMAIFATDTKFKDTKALTVTAAACFTFLEVFIMKLWPIHKSITCPASSGSLYAPVSLWMTLTAVLWNL